MRSAPGERTLVVSGLDKLPAVFSTLKQEGFDAVTLLSDAQFFSARRNISSLAEMHRLPAMYESRESVADGGLISYGASIPDLTRRAAAPAFARFCAAIAALLKFSELVFAPRQQPRLLVASRGELLETCAEGLRFPPSVPRAGDRVRRHGLRDRPRGRAPQQAAGPMSRVRWSCS